MFKLFVFAAILAFAFAGPNPEPKPQVLVAGAPLASVVAPGLAIPAVAQYTAAGVVAPAVVAAPGVVIV